jgi:2-oxopent-4-enoate/cis-2-oxohex-4-enoate hydratase
LGEEGKNPLDIELDKCKLKVFKNGNFISEGEGSEVQGHPCNAVAWLANTIGKFNIPFRAGEIILSGSLVPLEPVLSGDEMYLELEGVGSAEIKFK